MLKSIDLENFEIFISELTTVHNNIIYILDKSNINIFKIKDGGVVKRFGRKGQGSGEFSSKVYTKMEPVTKSSEISHLFR